MAQKEIDIANQTTVNEIKNISNDIESKIDSLSLDVSDIKSNTSNGNSESFEELQTNLTSIKNNTDINNTANSTGTLSQKISYIISTLFGTANASGGTSSAGSLMAKVNKLLTDWTTTRAGYIDTIKNAVTANSTASKTGSLSQKDAYIISLLENSTYGLSALKSSGGAAVKSVQRGIASSSKSITISAINISKSILLTSGDGISVDGDYGITSHSYGYIQSSTAIIIQCGQMNKTGGIFQVFWQVIEFY